MIRSLNLGILAHVDAGKTSLTERLLFAAGVIDAPGRVDDGNTRTDTLMLERQRGITIKSAVVSFMLDDVTVNLIDTPGHPDFIAEVERVVNLLDGAILIVSAVEGVQAQTRVLMRTLQRLRIPALLFINKIDRLGADVERVQHQIAERLAPDILPLGRVIDQGTARATFLPGDLEDPEFRSMLIDHLTRNDDELLRACLEDASSVTDQHLREALEGQTRQMKVYPVLFGSAMTGAGVDDVVRAIPRLLPARQPDCAGPLSGTVFKIDRGSSGERIAWLALESGTIRYRQRVPVSGRGEAKVTAISVADQGELKTAREITAGRIGTVQGLDDVEIGDAIGENPSGAGARLFSPPTLETMIVPRNPDDRSALHVALTRLAEQDPFINLRWDAREEELYVSLYGEVQKEVVQETLWLDFGLDVEFRESITICIERPLGIGAAFEIIDVPPNPFLATVGLRVEPGPIDSGVRYDIAQEVLGTMPHAFYSAVEETVGEALGQGLHGWEVTDCLVTLTHTGYWPRQSAAHATFDKSISSTAGDFRGLTPLVLMNALKQAGTVVCQPMHRFRLELPRDLAGSMLATLALFEAIPDLPDLGNDPALIEGTLPAARVHELQQNLPALTRGEGVFESSFLGYEPVTGTPPSRARTDSNPLNRKEYLIHVLRRV